MKKTVMMIAVLAMAAGCESVPDEPLRANAQLTGTTGNKTFGEATFEQSGSKVKVSIFVQGLKSGQEHGLHIHEGAECGPDGMKAGGHFNPGGGPHAHPSSGSRHAGDLPALKANKAGRGNVQGEFDMISVGGGSGNIIGRTLVVHADPDDYKTQPTGNSGARIACGVIKAG